MRILPAEAIEEVKKGNKISAIKVVKETWGLGLKESKDAVEDYCRAHPEIVPPSLKRPSGGWPPALSWTIRFVFLGVLIYLVIQRLKS